MPGASAPAAPGELPDDGEVAALLRRVGYEKIEMDPERRTLSKRLPSLTADLSAVAKGYAADRVAVVLGSLGHGSFMVEIGGEVVASGSNGGGDSWRIAIEKPVPGSPPFSASSPCGIVPSPPPGTIGTTGKSGACEWRTRSTRGTDAP